MTDEQLREIELDGNEIRLDLSAADATKARPRQIEAAEWKSEQDRISSQVAKKKRRHPKGGNRGLPSIRRRREFLFELLLTLHEALMPVLS